MSYISRFSTAPDEHGLPPVFPSPFSNTPHPLAKQAAVQLQKDLLIKVDGKHDFDAADGSRMLAVLVVIDKNDQIGFLSAFAGMLAGQWAFPGFVPPIFDWQERAEILSVGEAELARHERKITALQNSVENRQLRAKIEQLAGQRDIEVTSLKAIHRVRKASRHEQRHQARKDDERLAELSFESQQDRLELKRLNAQWCARLVMIDAKLTGVSRQVESLKKARDRYSNRLRKQLFFAYVLSNRLKEKMAMAHFYEDHHPPHGAGDCAAPKLIHYAQQHEFTPLALAEFWWGVPPPGRIRHHGHFYPACRGKCRPILPFMLKGLDVQRQILVGRGYGDDTPLTLHEDDDLVVLNKPNGLLSVPGKEVQDSVLTRLRKRYPHASGPLLVHRLDMATSGVLLAAKNAATHKALQQQFEQRSVEKRYVAVLSKRLPEHQNKGTIKLPLRVDVDDRPRQMVCFSHGKPARTDWEVIARQQSSTRVYFYPLTGRTHQLRMHAAHKDGLDAPIVGDELYGGGSERLLLHAERLCFIHPRSGERVEIEVPAPF